MNKKTTDNAIPSELNTKLNEAKAYQEAYDKTAKSYAIINNNTSKFRKALLEPFIWDNLPDITGKKMFDLGCGSGHYFDYLLNLEVSKILAVDLSSELLSEMPDEIKNDSRVEIRNASFLEDMSIETDKYDFGLSIFSVVHCFSLDTLNQFTKNAFNLLTEGGILFIVDIDTNKFVEHDVKRVIRYGVKADSFPLQDGDSFTVVVNKAVASWEITDYYWANETMMKSLKNSGFKESGVLLLEKVESDLYSEEEKEIVIRSGCMRIVYGLK